MSDLFLVIVSPPLPQGRYRLGTQEEIRFITSTHLESKVPCRFLLNLCCVEWGWAELGMTEGEDSVPALLSSPKSEVVFKGLERCLRG